MYKNFKIYLTSFYSTDLLISSYRFIEQAKKMNIFDDIFLYNEYTLPYDEMFYLKCKDKLKPSRGFGYWCWKPFIILKTLEKIENDSILIYLDTGCHLNVEGIERFYEYLDLVIKNDSLCFGYENDYFLERKWTKYDLLKYFNVINDENVINTPQRASGIIFLKNNKKNMEIINKWQQVYYDDFSLIDDSPSKTKNFEDFNENRHDQSVFSILSKINNFQTVPAYEMETDKKNYPINALRDKEDIYTYIYNKSSKYLAKKIAWYIPCKNHRDIYRKFIEINTIELSKSIYDKINFKYHTSNVFFVDIIIKISLLMMKKRIINFIKLDNDYLKKIENEIKNYKTSKSYYME